MMRTDRVESLLSRMREAQWEIERTPGGHYRAKAPDGKTTIHVPGKNGAGRTLVNTEGLFQRWERRQKINGAAPARHACEACGETFDTTHGLNAHSRVHTAQDVTCDLCGGTYRSGNGITKHMRAVHKTDGSPRRKPSAAARFEPGEDLGLPDLETAVATDDPQPEDSLLAVSEDLLALAARVERLAQREASDADLRSRLRDLLGP